MSWATIEEQHKATFHREYVACHEPHERNWLIENVIQTLPHFRKSVVENAVVQVCTTMKSTPRLRTDFFVRLKLVLEDTKRLAAQVR
jgi:hypothetical protein